LKGMKFSIIIGLLAVLIFCGMYFTVIKEKSEKIKTKTKEYEELETKLSKTIAVVKRKKEAARKLKIVSAKWNQAKKMLPTEASISTLLTTLTKQSSKNEVKIKHLMERIVNVRNLKLSPVSRAGEGEIQISASFNLLTYVTKGGKIEG
jgi:Tfp pilus assembly protein PilO